MSAYESIGSIKIFGCSIIRLKKIFLFNFPIGSRVFIKKKAKYGVLESVVIKKNYITEPDKITYQGINPLFFYVDTFNRVWIEDELVWEAEALVYVKSYWEKFERDKVRLGC